MAWLPRLQSVCLSVCHSKALSYLISNCMFVALGTVEGSSSTQTSPYPHVTHVISSPRLPTFLLASKKAGKPGAIYISNAEVGKYRPQFPVSHTL